MYFIYNGIGQLRHKHHLRNSFIQSVFKEMFIYSRSMCLCFKFVPGEKDGYAGVSLYSKQKPLDVKYGIGNKDFDKEGRLIMAEYEKFYLVATCKLFLSKLL